MDDWDVSKEMRAKTLHYYDELWKRRKGFKTVPLCINKLPRCLLLELNVDIFWEALRHSHIFCNVEIPVKRELTIMMKSEFFVPGDIIYKKNELKSKMIFIVSGVVQVFHFLMYRG